MKILLHNQQAWDASTPELEKAAFLALFKYLDKELILYEFDNPHSPYHQFHKREAQDLYNKAKVGDWEAAKQLTQRAGWELIDVVNPLKKVQPNRKSSQQSR